jgi:hypothetical protein
MMSLDLIDAKLKAIAAAKEQGEEPDPHELRVLLMQIRAQYEMLDRRLIEGQMLERHVLERRLFERQLAR